MTAAQMKIHFLLLYDKVTNLAAPGYEDSEITEFLNKSQLQFVKSRYNYKGNQYKEGFEKTEKRRKDLSELVRNIDLISSDISPDQTGVSPNGIFYDLPADFLYSLREEITTSSDIKCSDKLRITVKPVTHDEYSINVKNPFKKPDITQAWRLDFSRDVTQGPNNPKKRHEIITDSSYTVSTYHVRYLKEPRNIDITNSIESELSESVHEEIVDGAVRIATGITDPQSYQIKLKEELATE